MKYLYTILLFALSLSAWQAANAQDTLHIDQIYKVNKGEELKIKAGTIVSFKPGARIWVEGALSINGTKEQPVVFISENKSEPGTGIVINGIDAQSTIHILHTNFTGLLQPLLFEPFWSRKEVHIEGISINRSEFSEAIVYVAAPMSNQNESPISFQLTHSNFYNNKSGIILENVGASGIQYELDQLSFEENRILGEDNSLGIIHLNIAAPYFEKNLLLGNMAFNRNKAGTKSIGLSVSGNTQIVNAKGIYTEKGQRTVYDYYADPRLPEIKAPVKSLEEWPEERCFIQDLTHLTHLVLVNAGKSCVVSAILDSNDSALPFQQNFKNDSLQISYTEGIPKRMLTANGLLIDIPEIDHVLDSATGNMPFKASLPEPPKIIPEDTLIKPLEKFSPSYEVGAWGGLATYVGDIHHKFGIPGIYEWTGGFYLQYNRKRNWSYRATYYRTNIGMHDPTAPLFIWQGAPLYFKNEGILRSANSWLANFKTKMYILDFDAIYYFTPKHDNLFAKNTEGHWITGFGFGGGFMRFDPYRVAIYNRSIDSAQLIPLRPLGLEGQNFVKNKKPYGAYTINFNVSFQLAYVYRKFKFKYEIKAVLSMSDYLDDYGTGFLYGGNYEKWLASNSDLVMPYNKRKGTQLTVGQVFKPYRRVQTKRTTNLLPDMFFQQHVGVSYDLGDIYGNWKKRKK